MAQSSPRTERDEEAAEREGLGAAVAQARANPRSVPHEAVQTWLSRLAAGEFDAEPPAAT